MDKCGTTSHTGSVVARVNKDRASHMFSMRANSGLENKLTVGAWNVRTLLDRSENTNIAERRTALVAIELGKYNIDIAALSETRLPETGSLTEELSGYTFFWSGKSHGERRDHGVGFVIKTDICDLLHLVPTSINERLMSLRFPLKKNRYITMISAYAPTLLADEESKDLFYSQLHAVVNISRRDKLILLGDFNARVGSSHMIWPGVLGPHGIGNINTNGERLLSFCTEHGLTITNTYFKQPLIHKATWMHPRSKHLHLIDFVITKQVDRNDVISTRAMRGADCFTDHVLLRSKIHLNLRKQYRKMRLKPPGKLDVRKLKLDSVKKVFSQQLEEEFDKTNNENADCLTAWNSFKDSIMTIGKKVLGKPNRQHQDWFDDNNQEIHELITRRNIARTNMLGSRITRSTTSAYKTACQALQMATRKMKSDWWEEKAKEIQQHADMNNMKGFYNSLKMVWGPKIKHPTQLKSRDGSSLITEQKDLLLRWSNHFENLLNVSGQVASSVVERLKQYPTSPWLDEPPEETEVKSAIENLADSKAAGGDGIAGELLKYGGPATVQALWKVICKAWTEKYIPQEWKDANMITIFKKGDRMDCNNYRGISLLSVAGKVMARVILNRLMGHVEQSILPETQCGFRSERSTIDMIFTLKQVQEKCREQNMPLYIVFIDFTKAFDTVNRKGLWHILKKYGCPDHFISLIMGFHDNMYASVNVGGELSEPFPVKNGVKQGCVLAPTLFSIFLSAVLDEAFSENRTGIYIQTRPGANLFNLAQFKARTRTKRSIIRELMFADDTALVAHTLGDIQEISTLFAKATKDFGLKINMRKTEVLYQPSPSTSSTHGIVNIEGSDLTSCKSFTYLGSTITDDSKLDTELQTRMSKAAAAYGRLRERLWDNNNVRAKVKCQVYRAIVISTLLYGAESWTIYKAQVHKLHVFMMRHLRSILRIKWWQHVSNAEVLKRADILSMNELLMQRNLRWAGHVARMEEERVPKQILFSQLTSGVRSVGRPKLRYKDTIKRNLKEKSIPPDSWYQLAQDREKWKKQIRQSVMVDSDRLPK